MTLRVSGKNLDIGDALRAYVQTRIDAAVSKYAAGPIIGHVTIEPEGSGYRTDCTLHLNSGATLQADAKAREPYASFDRAADKIEKRVRRHKKRRSDHHAVPRAGEQTSRPEPSANGAADGSVSAEPAWSDAETLQVGKLAASADGQPPGLNPAIIAEPSSAFREMTVSSAVMELDSTNAPVVVFRHAFDGRTNVVYRRPDGNIGWIDPNRA